MWPRVLGNPFRSLGNKGGGGNSYRLLDTFSTAFAAGSVNGTFADTGQARTVTDTNSKLSIAGGMASFATGGVGAGDPGLWYPAITRQLGLVLLGTLVVTTTGMEFGWDATAAGSIAFSVRIIETSLLGVRDNATAVTVGAAPVSGTTYLCAVVLRSSGAYFFIKGGVYTNWTLIWASSQSNSNLLPGFTVTAGTTVGTVDIVKDPTALYIPPQIAADTFTRSNGALGSTETTGSDGQVLTALAWAFTSGIWTVSGNAAVGTPTLGSNVVVNGTFAADTDWNKGAGWTIGSGTANASAASSNLLANVAPLTIGVWYQNTYTVSAFSAGTVNGRIGSTVLPTHAANATYIETGRCITTANYLFTGTGFTGSLDNAICQALTLAELFASVSVSTADVIADVAITLSAALGGRQAGLVLNLDSTSSPANFILVYLDGYGNCVIDECVAGTYTNKQTTAVTYSAGAVLRVVRSGTECRVFYNNAAVGSAQTMTANTNTKHGLFSTHSSNQFDNFTLMSRGTDGSYEGLSAF